MHLSYVPLYCNDMQLEGENEEIPTRRLTLLMIVLLYHCSLVTADLRRGERKSRPLLQRYEGSSCSWRGTSAEIACYESHRGG